MPKLEIFNLSKPVFEIIVDAYTINQSYINRADIESVVLIVAKKVRMKMISLYKAL